MAYEDGVKLVSSIWSKELTNTKPVLWTCSGVTICVLYMKVVQWVVLVGMSISTEQSAVGIILNHSIGLGGDCHGNYGFRQLRRRRFDDSIRVVAPNLTKLDAICSENSSVKSVMLWNYVNLITFWFSFHQNMTFSIVIKWGWCRKEKRRR